jgi:hypothetical protein
VIILPTVPISASASTSAAPFSALTEKASNTIGFVGGERIGNYNIIKSYHRWNKIRIIKTLFFSFLILFLTLNSNSSLIFDFYLISESFLIRGSYLIPDSFLILIFFFLHFFQPVRSRILPFYGTDSIIFEIAIYFFQIIA